MYRRRNSWAVLVFVGVIAAVLMSGSGAARSAESETCLSISMQGDPGELLQRLVDKYDERSAEAMKDVESFAAFKQTLTDCVLDLAFADFSQGGGKVGHQPRTTALLRFLDRFKLGWSSDPARVQKLKEFAKRARSENKGEVDFVLDLDRAVAKGPGGLLRVNLDDCAPDYEDTAKRKIADLTEILNRGDYAGGPLQVLVHDILSVAFEEAALISMRKGDTAAAAERGRNAIRHLRAALATISPGSGVVNRREAHYFENDFWFRIAVLQRLLGEENWSESLRGILERSITWDPAADLDHVYVRSFIRSPRAGACSATGTGTQLTDDPDVINAFFNPGQLALYLCGWESVSSDIKARPVELRIFLNRFVNRDYRVYLRSSRNPDQLGRLVDQYNDALSANWKDIEAAMAGADPASLVSRSSALAIARRGAKQCGVDEERLARILGPFEPGVKGTWDAKKDKKVRLHGIYVGDFLSRAEADALAAELQKLLGLKDAPYAARPKING
jgi:hypothetical protein